jgi:DNA repair protein RecN (Recombination protein N)
VLTELRVRDLAVIADVTLPLKPGLNVLTGETGAGKSMLVDALALLLGERASADVVRPGAQKVVVEGAFDLTSTVFHRPPPSFADLGVDVGGDGTLVIKREVSAEGRSRAWVNGSPTTVGVLAKLGALLVDLHGQHETQSLLRADAQRDILDAFAEGAVERGAVRDAHDRWKGFEQQERELHERRAEVRNKADYLRHVVNEIEKAKPRLGEDDELDTESRRLAHADDLGRLAKELEGALDTAALNRAARALAGLERLDPSVAGWRELLDGAFANVQELAAQARDYAGGIENDPARLGQVEERRDLLFRLKQKYGPATADILATRDRSARELELLDTADLDLRTIAQERDAAAQDFTRACAALSEKRRKSARRLAKEVDALAPALGMPGARFGVALSPLPAPRADGAEGVVFEVELNPGMGRRPLARVASGGESSRLMLALKVVLAEHDAVGSLVFDEVDQGIGGEIGTRVGQALAQVAQRRQALVITHLPQIAAHADHHLVVAKESRAGAVATSDVQAVTGEARTRELARMLGDPDMATALRHAGELLKTAGAKPAARSETRSAPARAPRPPR